MHLDIVIYVLITNFVGLISPGPDFFIVLKNSMTTSRKAGWYTTLGIACGGAVFYAIGMLGMGTILAKSKGLLLIFKIVGAGYLVYLAFKAIFSQTIVKEPQLVYVESTHVPMSSYFKMGLTCNLTNPKAFMFIIALATYAVVHDADGFWEVTAVVMGGGIEALIWFSLVSVIFGNFAIRRMFYQKQRIINLGFGIILLYVATRIIIM